MRVVKAVLVSLIFLASCAHAGAPATSAQSPHAVIEALFAAFNRHDAAGMAALYAPEAELRTSEYCEPLRGRAAIERIHTDLFAAFPDIQDEVTDYFVDGEEVAVLFTSRSQTPGRAFEMQIADFFVVRDGLIVSDHTIFNAGRRCQPAPAWANHGAN
jgi:uncharacterized protein (TIGR02246 family)